MICSSSLSGITSSGQHASAARSSAVYLNVSLWPWSLEEDLVRKVLSFQHSPWSPAPSSPSLQAANATHRCDQRPTHTGPTITVRSLRHCVASKTSKDLDLF